MLAPEDSAILPWGWTAGKADVLRGIKECGFNLAGFVAPKDLNAVGKSGLKCIVFDPKNHVGDAEAQLDEKEIARRVKSLVARVGKHKSVFGYYLRDEPSVKAYAGLRKWKDAYKKFAPDKLAYINLFPNYASPEQMGVPTYRDYLDAFVETVQPSFVSYDHYALMEGGGLRDLYFPNLEAVRAVSQKHGLPFWNIVLSNAHFHYAEPSDAGFRFQLYTTLAYGARGISCFTYFAPISGNYRLAPIDQFGNKTPTWEMLRNVNLQMHRLGAAYLKLKSVNVFHHPEVPQNCSGIATSRFVAAIEGKGSYLVGEFQDPEDRPWVIIVNKSLSQSAWFRVKFRDSGTIHFVNAYTGNKDLWQGENDWLAAGQGMLLSLEK
jgi:hypothetical protein